MDFDSNVGEVVMTGGQFVGADAWSYNGTTWVQDGSNPNDWGASADGRGVAFDVANSKIVAFGGSDGFGVTNAHTWTRDNAGTWAQQTPVLSPSARRPAVMAYCPAISAPILWGGWTGSTYPTDTFKWTGTNWVAISTAHAPSGRDLTCGCTYGTGVLLYGGGQTLGSRLSDTWFFNGTDWLVQSPATVPTKRDYLGLGFYDSASKAILFGGNDGGSLFGDTWSWNGTDWTQESPSVSPSARYGMAMCWEDTLDGVLLFGGDTGGVNAEKDETWLFQYDAEPVASVASIHTTFGVK